MTGTSWTIEEKPDRKEGGFAHESGGEGTDGFEARLPLTGLLFVHIFVQKGDTMSQAITYSEARQNLAETMNRVCDHHEPVIITRQKSPSVVMMSLEDYNSIMETAYLLRSPANAARLREAIQAADTGKAIPHELED